jgi:hypothetical protein
MIFIQLTARYHLTAPRYFYLSGVDQESYYYSGRSLRQRRNIILKRTTISYVWEGEKQQRTCISRYWNKTVHWLQV